MPWGRVRAITPKTNRGTAEARFPRGTLRFCGHGGEDLEQGRTVFPSPQVLMILIHEKNSTNF
ncbi:hypothetical protein AKJ48_04155 [candidate division MSBL1 archaeon SCGC-AAA261O19]|uniref:Uncharacterized protein n=1 Tax=candidate division MSBL1 archaeon SCGC-AAA261O19 TaxID=1698277 RepID=A0A133V9Q4_9EURY|nr:hypothetical protein AKJ48_04155 [candidate division MSBL1 archaeon SCGC-AAA261O19]